MGRIQQMKFGFDSIQDCKRCEGSWGCMRSGDPDTHSILLHSLMRMRVSMNHKLLGLGCTCSKSFQILMVSQPQPQLVWGWKQG